MSRLLLVLIIALTVTPFEGFPTGTPAGSIVMEPMDTCTGILSSDQLQDIQFKKSDILYAIINGQLVAKVEPMDLYIELLRIVNELVGVTTVSDVWLSHVPCAACIQYLEFIFGPFTVKPVLHIESLRHNGSNYEILHDLGCLAKLTTTEYRIKAWNWNVFNATYGHSCDYYSTAKYNTDYKKHKSYTETVVNFLEGNFTRDILAKLCVV